MTTFAEISEAAAASGLMPLGGFLADGDERRTSLAGVAEIVVFGLDGERGWRMFAASREACDGAADPLDRWSRRVLDALGDRFDARAFYPFAGPPYWPFQRWAMRADGSHVSPLGLTIHAERGLWGSFRGALGFAQAVGAPLVEQRASPCESCAARPCLTACPVGAFSSTGYDTAVCAAYLRTPAGGDCLSLGCKARRACPVGAKNLPSPERARFHMSAFLASRSLNP